MEFQNLEISGIEVLDLNDAMALPETGASSGSGGNSLCGSSSCCSSCCA